MGETYRLEAEEESCEAAHKMRDELELQLKFPLRTEVRPAPEPMTPRSARSAFAKTPPIQRSRRT